MMCKVINLAIHILLYLNLLWNVYLSVVNRNLEICRLVSSVIDALN